MLHLTRLVVGVGCILLASVFLNILGVEIT